MNQDLIQHSGVNPETVGNMRPSPVDGILFARVSDVREAFARFSFARFALDLPEGTLMDRFQFANGYSGYSFRAAGGQRGRIAFATILGGGYVLQRTLENVSGANTSWTIFSESGELVSEQNTSSHVVEFVSAYTMDPGCPIVNHLYNYLSFEYDRAATGEARPRQMAHAERLLRDLEKGSELSARFGATDPAIESLSNKVLAAERSASLTWEERQIVFQKIFFERGKIVKAKKRIHGYGFFSFTLPRAWRDLQSYGRRLIVNPVNNFKGILYKYTVGRVIWFFQTVRNNIGYSIALAIYGPFTFYFITQPLNPHAMWAVGKVRSSYIDTVSSISRDWDKVASLVGVGAAVTVAGDSVTRDAPVAPIEDPSAVPGAALDFSKDHPEVAGQDWVTRMSNFKAMQIGYEENMLFSMRMGRLEQMETQLNFPLIVESAWREVERYLEQIKVIRSNMGTGLSKDVAEYFTREEARARLVQLYIWEKNIRFVLDHPYIMMDEAREQTQRDYYVGRAFLFQKEMNTKVRQFRPDLMQTEGVQRLEKIAKEFEKMHEDGNSVLDRLKKNSKLFQQKNRYDGEELRSYMKRHWEVLFLLQNKAQEAANFGLQSYVWSVRNAIWIFQSLYSAKTRELAILFDRHGRFKKDVSMEVRRDIEPIYESLHHMLNLEFVSILPEISGKLPNDLDVKQRRVVLKALEDSLVDREKNLSSLVE